MCVPKRPLIDGYLANEIRITLCLYALQNSRRRAIRGLLHVSGDGLRVVDEDTKGLIVDQTIEKVSFCAPDRNHERGFSYICRDGTTRRWMCHGFLASKDSGERLSHAVGCAFAVCLERKQRRDNECGVTMTFDMKNSTFTRSGSFRTQTMTERLQQQQQNGNGGMMMERGIDIGGGIVGPSGSQAPPSAMVTPQPKPHNPFAIERPHVTPSMLERLERQGSFRAVSNQSPFKRQMSLRINDLPSNTERQRSFLDPMQQQQQQQQQKNSMRSVSPIPEVSPHKPSDTVAQLCAELSQGLSLLTTRTDNDNLIDDLNFNNTTSVNQNTASVSLIHSPLSPPVVSVFPPLSATVARDQPPIALALPYRYTTSNSTSINNGINLRQQQQDSSVRTTPDSPLKPINSSKSGPIAASPSAAGELPKPADWLAGQIVQSTSPASQRASIFTAHARTKTLQANEADVGVASTDPFDAEWVAGVARLSNVSPISVSMLESQKSSAFSSSGSGNTSIHSNIIGNSTPTTVRHTNPFITPPKPPAQSFQVQL